MKNHHKMSAFLGRDTEFEGKLKFQGSIRIDGYFKGEISGDGTLVVGEGGVLECNVHAACVVIRGEIRGNVIADQRIEAFTPGKIFGNLTSPTLVIDEGVVFEGTCAMHRRKELPATFADAKKIALVVAGRLGDRSFYESANGGLMLAAKELGVETTVFECVGIPVAFSEKITAAARDHGVIFTMGRELAEPMMQVASKFPDRKFIHIDAALNGPSNVSSIRYLENEASFLAGALAAMMATKERDGKINLAKVVGAVGGKDIPGVWNLMTGYEAGAKYVDPGVAVEIEYVDRFEDVAGGRKAGLKLSRKGANIIFEAAGRSGNGVIGAAKEANFYVIGADSDRESPASGFVVGRVVKEIEQSIFDTVRKILEGTHGNGAVITYDMAHKGVGLSMDEEMKEIVGPEIMEKLEKIQCGIVEGTIEVPEARN